MKRICIIDYHQKIGGLSTYINELSSSISINKRIELNFIFVRYGNIKEIERHYIKQDVIEYRVPFELGVNEDEKFVSYLSKEFKNENRIIFHFNWINHAPFAQLLRLKYPSCITILTKHCIPWRDNVTNNYSVFTSINKQLFSNSNSHYLHQALIREQIAYTSVDHIICVTALAQKNLNKLFGIKKEQTTIVYNGFDECKVKNNNRKLLKQQYGFNKNDKILLFAGAVNQRKGIYDLIAAFDKVLAQEPQARLVIAGEGEHSTVLKSTCNNWARITITGGLNKKTLYDFYQMADIGVVPSYVEQCSYTAIEMMHHGLPIIVSDVDGLSEIVSEGCGMKVPLVLGKTKAYIHPQKMTAAILYFLNNLAIAQQYAARAKQHACKHFTAKKMAAETIKVYEKLIAQADALQPSLDIVATDPLVTVVLPCYNAEKYLQECIYSVLQQSYTKLELIIIDDGSTDSSAAIIQKFKDNRIILIKNTQNEGIVKSLNKGIKAAKGKYIARIDADDRMHENRLYAQVQFLEKEENKEIAIVGSHQYIINANGMMISLLQYPLSNKEIKALSYFLNPFSHPAVMIRAAVFKQIKYSHKYAYAEDYDLWFKILKHHKTANLPEYLTYYRVHDSNISAQNSKVQKEAAAALIMDALDNAGINYTDDELKLHLAVYSRYGTKYFNTKEKICALKNWITKLLQIEQSSVLFSNKELENIKSFVLAHCCGIFE